MHCWPRGNSALRRSDIARSFRSRRMSRREGQEQDSNRVQSHSEMTENAPRKLIIAIDGPAGAGKSTIASRLARKLGYVNRSEEHTSELQSRLHIVCRLLF